MYKSTALEDWINQRYFKYGFNQADDIDIEHLAYIHSVFIHYKPMSARYDVYGRYRGIVLDSRCSPKTQREQFFHELCHILRHVGHQTMMPKAFRELQEWDANNFTMYAALPYFMVKKYDFDNPYLIYHLATDFKVTEDLCMKRIEKIKNNYLFNSSLVAERIPMYNKP